MFFFLIVLCSATPNFDPNLQRGSLLLLHCQESHGVCMGCVSYCLSWAQWIASICWQDWRQKVGLCVRVCVSLVFEVAQIALTSLLRRAAGIESSFLNSRFLLRQSWDYPPLMHKASAFLSNLLVPASLSPLYHPSPPPIQPQALWPCTNTQRWPVTHNAEM